MFPKENSIKLAIQNYLQEKLSPRKSALHLEPIILCHWQEKMGGLQATVTLNSSLPHYQITTQLS
jgi:hypothetical protein